MLIELELNAREIPFCGTRFYCGELHTYFRWYAKHLFLPIVIWKTFPTCRIEYLYLLLTLASSEMCWEGFIVNIESMLEQFIAVLEYYQEILKW